MIKTGQIDNGMDIAHALGEEQLQATAKPGSVLGVLCEYSDPGIPDEAYSDAHYGEHIRDRSMSEEDGEYLHDQAMEVAVGNMVNRMNSILGVAHSVVKPFICTTRESITEALTKVKADIISKWSVEVYNYPEVLANPIMDELVSEDIENGNFVDVKQIAFPRDGLAGILGTDQSPIVTTFDDLNESVTEMVGLRGGKDYLDRIYRKFFVELTQRANIIKPTVSPVEDLVTAYLMARWLRDNPVENVPVSLSTYRGSLGNLIHSLARSIKYVETTIRTNQDRSRQLVKSIDAESGKVCVFGDRYEEWLTNGGKAEYVMGAALNGKALPYEASEQLLAASEAAYRNHIQTRRALADQKAVRNISDVARKVIIAYLSDLDESNPLRGYDEKLVAQYVDKCFANILPKFTNLSQVLLCVVECMFDDLFPGNSVIKFVRLQDQIAQECILAEGTLTMTPEEITRDAVIEMCTCSVVEDILVAK